MGVGMGRALLGFAVPVESSVADLIGHGQAEDEQRDRDDDAARRRRSRNPSAPRPRSPAGPDVQRAAVDERSPPRRLEILHADAASATMPTCHAGATPTRRRSPRQPADEDPDVRHERRRRAGQGEQARGRSVEERGDPPDHEPDHDRASTNAAPTWSWVECGTAEDVTRMRWPRSSATRSKPALTIRGRRA